MARPSKFSMSALGRGTSSEKKNGANQQQNGYGQSLDVNKMSKAETLLGPVETINNKSHSKWSPRNLLQKKTTSLSVAVSEIYSGLSGSSRQSGPGWHSKASSAILGPNASMTSVNTTSTLHSYYDPSAVPLSVSQQTAASSARDMALRKGYRPVQIHSPLHESIEPDTGFYSLENRDQFPNDDVGRKDRKKLQIGLGTSNAQSKHMKGQPLSPSATIRSTSSLSVTSGNANSVSSVKWRGWRNSKIKSPTTHTHDPMPPVTRSPAGGSRRDMSFVPASERHRADLDDIERMERRLGNHRKENTAQSPGVVTHNSSSSSVQTLTSEQSGTTIQAPQSLPPPSLPQPQPPRQQPRRPENRIIVKSPNREAQKLNLGSPNSITAATDLHKQSVLSLSSSEDESETDTRPIIVYRPGQARTVIPGKYAGDLTSPRIKQSPRLRDMPEKHSQVSTRSIKSSLSPSPSTKSSLRSHKTPPVPVIPKRTTSHAYQHNNPPQHSSNEQRSSEAVYTAPSEPIPKPKLIDTPPTSPASVPHVVSGRVMVVSKEEEMLLEAMREKRASMRRTGSTEGYTSSIDQIYSTTIPRRPKTAETEKRTSSLYETQTPDVASFPIPPRFRSEGGRIIHRSRSSFSTDDLHLSEDVIYAERNSIISALNGGFLGPSQTSSRLSLSSSTRIASEQLQSNQLNADHSHSDQRLSDHQQSDHHPSPAASRGEPSTPPPEQYGRGEEVFQRKDRTGKEPRQEEIPMSQWAVDTQMELRGMK